jgi:hypothetical protein
VIEPDLFARFASAYHTEGAVGCAPDDELLLFPSGVEGLGEFLTRYAGASFNRGLYRVHDVRSIPRWNQVVGEAFPEVARRIHCFAWDWLGRQFAIDGARQVHGQPLLLMLEPGSGLVLEVPATFLAFHNQEIVDDPDGILAASLFAEWQATADEILSPTACVGFKVPLFLGGIEDPSNLEATDGEVYWSVCGQVWNQVRHLPPGTPIGSVRLI